MTEERVVDEEVPALANDTQLSNELPGLSRPPSISIVGRFDKMNYNKHEIKIGTSVTLTPIKEAIKLEQHIIKTSTQHLKWIIHHTLVGILFILLMLILTKFKNFTFSNTLGVIVFIDSTYLLIFFSIFLIQSKNLYSVTVLKRRIPEWTKMSLPHQIRKFENRSITSISELIAIQGGKIGVSFKTVSMRAFTIVIASIGYKISQNKPLQVQDIFLLLSGFATHSVCVWDINQFSKISTTLHYIALLFICLIYPVIVIQHGWNYVTIPVILLGFSLLLLFGWAMFIWIPSKKSKNGENTVHRNSLICLIPETIFLGISFWCMASAVFFG